MSTCWEGALHSTAKLYYFTTSRQTSLKNIIEFHRQDEETAKFLQDLMFGVDHLHSLGFVHRNLRPENVFAMYDPDRPLIISGHEYTTQVCCQNLNSALPPNPYNLLMKDKRAGSK